jgi:hypothetical protein
MYHCAPKSKYKTASVLFFRIMYNYARSVILKGTTVPFSQLTDKHLKKFFPIPSSRCYMYATARESTDDQVTVSLGCILIKLVSITNF